MANISTHKRPVFYLASIVVFALSLIYCSLVYLAGSQVDPLYGYRFVLGIPNYFFFYLVILPFITAGVVYLAIFNKNIRFVGKLSESIEPDRRAKLLRYRRMLFFIAVIISIMVAMKDAMDKGNTIPPYSIDFSSMQANSYKSVVEKYFALKDSPDRGKPDNNLNQVYLQYLQEHGYQGDNVTKFSSIGALYSQTSYLYKLESFLSWLGAFIISVFFAEIFLIVLAKDHVYPETKNLILWLLILCSFWIPMKVFSVYYFSLYGLAPPGIVWFAIVLLFMAVLLALFIKIKENDIIKYASLIAGFLSALITAVSFFSPNFFEKSFVVVQQIGWTFGSIILFVIGFSIYLITDYLIQSYEKIDSTSAVNITGDHNSSIRSA